MSGRRKLPQIPGQSSPSSSNSRGTTPLGLNLPSGPASDISQGGEGPPSGNPSSNGGRNGGTNSDDTSREPEGRSQNSSPATSLVRGPIVESWRDLVGLEKSLDEIKHQLKDHIKSQDQISSREKSSHIFRSSLVCSFPLFTMVY